ncbi:MAG: hypothetical protein ACOVO1_09035 [Chitinophagaceae bacterium]
MKSKIIIAIVAIAALCSGLYFIVNKTGLSYPPIPKEKTVNIVGEWNIDTVYNNSDSNAISLLAIALFADSTTLQFNADSSLQTISPKETTKQLYYLHKDSLFVKQDSIYELSFVKNKKDSLIAIINKDSTVIVLSKKMVK